MMRTFIMIFFLLLANVLLGQDANTTLPCRPVAKAVEKLKTFAKPFDRTLAEHLLREHQVEPAGMSHEQMEQLHDELHRDIESLRPAGAFSFIVMETESWCGPCQRWKAEVKPALIAASWKIVELPADIKRRWSAKRKLGASIPAFFVVIGDRHWGHVGPLTQARLREIVNASKQ